jgi:hypothetical protein
MLATDRSSRINCQKLSRCSLQYVASFRDRWQMLLRLWLSSVVGDIGLVVQQIIEGAGMNSDLTIIFSSRSSRKWNTFWVCLPWLFHHLQCAPIILCVRSFLFFYYVCTSTDCLLICFFKQYCPFCLSILVIGLGWSSSSTNPALVNSVHDCYERPHVSNPTLRQ